MVKILLIQPSEFKILNEKKVDNAASMPIGLIYIGSYLKNNGHHVKILDRNLYPSNELLKNILKAGYDFVGISTFTSQMLHDALEVSKITKENSNSIVIWGGLHPTIMPKQTLENPYIDHVVKGEGEEIIVEMAKLYEEGKSLKKIKGIDLNPLGNPPDINKMPIPDYDLIETKKYNNFFISTSRGCPYKCTFCYNSSGCDIVKPYRNLTYENSVKLIEYLATKYKKRTFTIIDDNFPSDREKIKKMSFELKKMGLKFDALSRANYCDLETLSYMKKAGCWQVQIGVESGSQRILNFIKKGTSVEMNANAIKNCKKVGIVVHTAFMLGLPTETIEEIKMTLNFIKKTKPDLGGAGIFQPLPKTKLWDYCIEKKLIKEPQSVEEWANAYPPIFNQVKMKVNSISEKTIMHYYREMNKEINKRRYLKKIILYAKNGRIPDYRRVLSSIKQLIGIN